jgi:endo-1,4-beta-xylanase
MPSLSALVPLLAASVAFASPIEERATNSINDAIKADGKLYWGTCADSNTLGISQNSAIIQADFGQLTPENSMKW